MMHEFVESFPEILEEGVLYVSMGYRTATHLCACGCGRQVVTPIRKHGWTLTFDGETITLSPSIGSRNLACRSHYFIREGRVQWLSKMDSFDEKSGPVFSEESNEADDEIGRESVEKKWWRPIVFWRR